MTEREDLQWQKFFAACSLLFVIFTFVGLEVFWPQPPSFALSGEQTGLTTSNTSVALSWASCCAASAWRSCWLGRCSSV